MIRSVIFDTDPGQDDATALLLAMACPDLLNILGIVTVSGNVPLIKTTRNACQILELARRTDIPLYAGCDRSLLQAPAVTAEHVHGASGLDGADLPEPTLRPKEEHGVDYLCRTLAAADARSITICALGPLTNIALALIRSPSIRDNIAEIVLMGGGYFEGGNITPAAEFNFFTDPHAADIVLRSEVPITMASLDVTHQVLSTPERLDRLDTLGNECGRAVSRMLRRSEAFDRKKYKWPGAPLHDPCVVAWLIAPQIFSSKHVNVKVETTSPICRGASVVDWWGVTEEPSNVRFLRTINADAFYALLGERLRHLP
jgi:purine nucleosidase